MDNSRNTVHYSLERNRDLLFNLLCGNAGPLRDHIDIVVRYVRIGFDGKPVKGDDSPGKQQDRTRQNEKAVLQREIYKPSNHCASSVASSWRTFETTCWPGAMPERISCLFPGNGSPVRTWT